MTRCRGSLNHREAVKSESWVTSFGEFAPPQTQVIFWFSASLPVSVALMSNLP
jgi:hypothetical protein